MSDDDPERLRPAGAALNSFELLTPSPSPGDPFGGMSPELQERIRRKREERRAWENDPDNKEEGEFWWDVGGRGFELKMKEDELTVVPAIGAQAVAARNHEQRLIKAERIALKEDEREVRSAAPTEMLATIERVRRRWDKRDKIAAGLIAAEQGQGLAENSQAPTSTNPPDGELATGARAAAGHAGGSPVEPTPTEVASTERTVVASPDAVPVGATAQTANRPRPTDAAARQWFRDRVAGWPDDKPAPSGKEDKEAIAAYFAHELTRDEFRLVRKDETPDAWRKQGRRPLWGSAKARPKLYLP